MAEAIGLAASIIQIAVAGSKLSVALYDFTSKVVHADRDIKDIADDVELTTNALKSVGEVFEAEDTKSIISKKAIQDANNIIKKCESVFNELTEMIEKRRKPGKPRKGDEKGLNWKDRFLYPMKVSRIDVTQKRLESLKNSLVLLLHVLQLAQGQVRGKMEKSAVEEEREKIRELHQRQQDSLKSLQALENEFCKFTLNNPKTPETSGATSKVATTDSMADVQLANMPQVQKTDSQASSNTITIDLSKVENSDTSDSDVNTTDDEDEHLSFEELSQCAKEVQKLLKRVTVLQHNFESSQKTANHRKKRVHKIYQRFCRKFESHIDMSTRHQAKNCPHEQSFDGLCIDCGQYLAALPVEMDRSSPIHTRSTNSSKTGDKHDNTAAHSIHLDLSPRETMTVQRLNRVLIQINTPHPIQESILHHPPDQYDAAVKLFLALRNHQNLQKQRAESLDSLTTPQSAPVTGTILASERPEHSSLGATPPKQPLLLPTKEKQLRTVVPQTQSMPVRQGETVTDSAGYVYQMSMQSDSVLRRREPAKSTLLDSTVLGGISSRGLRRARMGTATNTKAELKEEEKDIVDILLAQWTIPQPVSTSISTH